MEGGVSLGRLVSRGSSPPSRDPTHRNSRDRLPLTLPYSPQSTQSTMPNVYSKIAVQPPVHCASSTLKFTDALAIARAAAHKSKKYDSGAIRERIRSVARDAFEGREPYDWQVDVCEAILLGLDCIIIAGTGAGKTLPFVMPLLMDETKQKMVVVISPLIELEEDQVCVYLIIHCVCAVHGHHHRPSAFGRWV